MIHLKDSKSKKKLQNKKINKKILTYHRRIEEARTLRDHQTYDPR